MHCYNILFICFYSCLYVYLSYLLIYTPLSPLASMSLVSMALSLWGLQYSCLWASFSISVVCLPVSTSFSFFFSLVLTLFLLVALAITFLSTKFIFLSLILFIFNSLFIFLYDHFLVSRYICSTFDHSITCVSLHFLSLHLWLYLSVFVSLFICLSLYICISFLYCLSLSLCISVCFSFLSLLFCLHIYVTSLLSHSPCQFLTLRQQNRQTVWKPQLSVFKQIFFHFLEQFLFQMKQILLLLFTLIGKLRLQL